MLNKIAKVDKKGVIRIKTISEEEFKRTLGKERHGAQGPDGG